MEMMGCLIGIKIIHGHIYFRQSFITYYVSTDYMDSIAQISVNEKSTASGILRQMSRAGISGATLAEGISWGESARTRTMWT